jgi:hypothetical protein
LRSLYCHNHSDIDQLIDWYLSDRGDYDLEHDHILQRLSIVIDSMEMSSQLALLWMLDACRKHHHTSWLVNVLRMVPFDLGWLPPCTSLHCPACQSTPNAVQP